MRVVINLDGVSDDVLAFIHTTVDNAVTKGVSVRVSLIAQDKDRKPTFPGDPPRFRPSKLKPTIYPRTTE